MTDAQRKALTDAVNVLHKIHGELDDTRMEVAREGTAESAKCDELTSDQRTNWLSGINLQAGADALYVAEDKLDIAVDAIADAIAAINRAI